MDEDGEERDYVVIKPRRIARYDLPLHLLNLATGIVGCVHTFFGDVTYSLAAHVIQHGIDGEFEGIVRNYDNPNSIGPGCPESED